MKEIGTAFGSINFDMNDVFSSVLTFVRTGIAILTNNNKTSNKMEMAELTENITV